MESFSEGRPVTDEYHKDCSYLQYNDLENGNECTVDGLAEDMKICGNVSCEEDAKDLAERY